MSMHLVHPSLNMIGKSGKKQKFKSAKAKQEFLELEESWRMIKKNHGVEQEQRRRQRAMQAEVLDYQLTAPAGRMTSHHIPSRNTGEVTAALREAPKYTGPKMLGIGTLHKSNAVPVFSDEEAVDMAKMRR